MPRQLRRIQKFRSIRRFIKSYNQLSLNKVERRKRSFNCFQICRTKSFRFGSGCGSVGRVVASDTRDPRFESSHRLIYLLLAVLKRRKKKKRPGVAHFLKKCFRFGRSLWHDGRLRYQRSVVRIPHSVVII